MPLPAQTPVPAPQPAHWPPPSLNLSQRIWVAMVLVGVILAVAQAGLTLDTTRLAESDLAEAVQRKAVVIGDNTVAALEYALSLGIPFTELRGMEAFLGTILEENRGLSYLVVTDADGTILYSRTAPDTLLPAVTIADSGTQRIATAGANGLNTTVLISHNARVVGFLHVGATAEFFALQDLLLPVEIIVVLLVGLIVLWEALSYVFVVGHGAPLSGLASILAQAAGGDLRHHGAHWPANAIGRLGQTVDSTIFTINDRFDRLASEAEDIKAGQLDETIAAQVDTEVATIRKRFSFAATDAPPDPETLSPWRVRFPYFLVFLAVGMTMPFFVPAALTEPTPTDVHQHPHIGGFHGLLAFGAAVLIGMVLTILPPLRQREPGLTLGLGIALCLAGFITGALNPVPTGLAMHLGAALLGAGVCLMTLAAWRYVGLAATGPAPNRRTVVLLIPSFSAAVCGPPIGGMLLTWTSLSVAWWAAVAVTLVAAVVAVRSVTPVLRQRRSVHPRIDSPLPAIAMFVGLTAATTVFLLIPMHADLHGADPSVIGQFLMAVALATLLGAGLCRTLSSDRWPALSVVALGGTSLAGAIALFLSHFEQLWSLAALFAGAGFCLGAAMAAVGRPYAATD